jgi:hypothetical protein
MVAVARSNRDRAGDPAWDVGCHARQCRTCPEARRTNPVHISAIVIVASAIPHPTSMLDRLCFTLDWSAVNGPSFR